MQIPVMNGIYTNKVSDIRTSYPVNLIPVPKENGIANGYLRPAEGIELLANTDGIDRGGINWLNVQYRVIGINLVKVNNDGTIDVIGSVGGSGQCTFTYSFDYLAIASSGSLYLYNGSELKKITDNDIGNVIDVLWVDGYFMTTDGNYLIVTELNNPFAVNPLKYGSAEIDPDPIQSIEKISNEVYAIGRYSIEVFDNIGGELFPFQRIEGAVIPRGTLGTFTCCKMDESLFFVGSSRSEQVAIYVAGAGTSQKISTREIDQIINSYSEDILSKCLLESRVLNGHQWLYFHLPDQTLVYDLAASVASGSPVWFILKTNGQYCVRNFVWCYDKWTAGHVSENKLGIMTDKVSNHFGIRIDWEFGTTIMYNQGFGALFHRIELVSLTGNIDFNKKPTISTQYSVDGETWSTEKFINAGGYGDRAKRLVWLQQGHMRNWRIQKFKGNSDARISVIRLEAHIEPLTV